MKRVRHFLRNFTATAVKEHLRKEIETTGGPDQERDRAGALHL
jgi:hypothetical protein